MERNVLSQSDSHSRDRKYKENSFDSFDRYERTPSAKLQLSVRYESSPMTAISYHQACELKDPADGRHQRVP